MFNLERAIRRILPGLPALLLCAVPVHAEVGVIQHLQGPTSYILQSIVDEPEPIDNSMIWLRYSGVSGGRQVLNEGGYVNGDGRPSMITEPGSNLPIVAWAKNSPSGFDIVVSRFDGAAWSAPQIVAGAPADELDPQLAVDPADGSIHVVYWIHDGSPRVMHRTAPADLSAWSAPVQVSSLTDVAVRPSAVFHEGALRVAYELHGLGYGSTPRQIVVATRSGSSFTPEILTTTHFDGDNWPRVHSAGDRLWVDWVDTTSEITWMRQIQGGPWESEQAEVYETNEERDFHVRGLVRQRVLD